MSDYGTPPSDGYESFGSPDDDFQDGFLGNEREEADRAAGRGSPSPAAKPAGSGAGASPVPPGKASPRDTPGQQPSRPARPQDSGLQPPGKPTPSSGAVSSPKPGPGASARPGQSKQPPGPAQKPQTGSPTRTARPASPASPPGGAPRQPKPTIQQRPPSLKKPAAKTTPPEQKEPPSRSMPPQKRNSLPGVSGIKVTTHGQIRQERRAAPHEPGWGERIQGRIPSYVDEMVAVLLIAVGLLSFFTLLSPSSGSLGTVWSRALRYAFGAGAYVISSVILAVGALLLMPKLGVRVRLNWWRVIAGEICFVFLLGYVHAGIRAGIGGEDGRIEAFNRAFDGHGGGMVGWAIQELVHMLLGDTVTGVVLLVVLVLSGSLVLGINRWHIIRGLAGFHNWLVALAKRLDPGLDAPPPIPTTRPAPQLEPPVLSVTTGEGNLEGEDNPIWYEIEEETDPDSSLIVELPPIPGRPSVVTGAVGAGALTMRNPDPLPVRTAPLTRIGSSDGGAPVAGKPPQEIVYRFTVDEKPDTKRVRKRSSRLPSLDLLESSDFKRPSEDEINVNAVIIEETAEDFGMRVQVIGVKAGPTVTQYAVQPFVPVEKDGQQIIERVRVTRVAALAQDLSLALAASSVRIQAPVPGTNYIGVEVPNARPGVVSLRPVVESVQFYKIKSPLAIALGRRVDGRPFAADLGIMPHLLIGGTTGSGKSVCITSIATCLIANNSPDRLRLIMIDPKMVELVRFNGLPHLLGRVEVQLDRIIGVLRWVTREMDRRYRLMEEEQARNIAVYNHGKRRNKRLPYIVILVDELAELMTEYPDETEHLVTRLAQMARATGIHLVVATQRPSTDIVTGLIKANFPARISFAVPSGIDSRVVIDTVGAEDLIGRGDMLFLAPDASGPVRLQGCFVSDGEMERVVNFWHETWDQDEDVPAPWERALTRAAVLDETDQMLEEAIRVVQKEGQASASLLQRKLNVSYPRAGRLIDALHQLGVVGEEQTGGRTREVLIPSDVDPTTYIISKRMER